MSREIEQIEIEIDGHNIMVERLADGTFMKPKYLLGVEREVVGTKRHDYPDSDTWGTAKNKKKGKGIWDKNGGGPLLSALPITAPSTEAAKLWDGYGSNLKPAYEPIILAMKPLDGTFANNALTHGVAGINVDAGRIGTEQTITQAKKGMHGCGSTQKMRDHGYRPYHIDNRNQPEKLNPPGRFPANVILTHDPRCEMVGAKKVKGSHKGQYRKDSKTGHIMPFIANKQEGYKVDKYNDPDGTETVEDWRCVEGCPVKMLDEQSGERPGPGHYKNPSGDCIKRVGSGSTVYPSFDSGNKDGRRRTARFSGDSGGASRFFKQCQYGDEDWDSCSLCDNGGELWRRSNAYGAKRSLKIIRAVIESIAVKNVQDLQIEKIALNVPFAGNLCDTCATRIALALVVIKIWDSNHVALQAILDCIGSFKRRILIQNLVQFAEQWDNIDTIPTTESLSLLCGSVLHAIEESTKSENLEEEESIKFAPSRFLYAAKASKRERGEFNTHCTVKPLKLLTYLLKLLAPPTGGTGLDPFMGSGSALVAAKRLGLPFIGIELEEENCEIAVKRLETEKPQNGELQL